MNGLLMRFWFLVLTFLLLAVPALSQTKPVPSPDDQKSNIDLDSEQVTHVVINYYSALRSKDWDRLTSLVDDPKGNLTAESFGRQLESLRKLLGPLKIVLLEESLRDGDLVQNGKVAVMKMTVSIKALDPISNSPVVNLLNTNRTLLLVKDKVRSWVIFSDSPDEEGLSDAILAAKTEIGIECLLNGANLSDAANGLVEKGRGEIREGRLSAGFEALRLALFVRDQKIAAETRGYEDKLDKVRQREVSTKKELSPGSFLEIGYEHLNLHHYDLALQYFLKNLDWCKGQDDATGIAMALLGVAKTYQEQGNYQAAIDYYKKSGDQWARLPKFKEITIPGHGTQKFEVHNESVQKGILTDLVGLYETQGQPEAAAEVFLEGLRAFGVDEDSPITISSIGKLFLAEGKIKGSLAFLGRVSNYLGGLNDQQTKDKDNEADVQMSQLGVLGLNYSSYLGQANFLQAEKQLEEFDKALRLLLERAKSEEDDPDDKKISLDNASSVSQFLGGLLYEAEDENNEPFNLRLFDQNWASAGGFFTQGTDIMGELGEADLWSVMVEPAGQFLARKQYDLALPYYLNALKLGELSKKPVLVALANSRLAQLYYSQGNRGQALEYLTKSLAYCDTRGATFLEERFKSGLTYEDLMLMATIYKSQRDYDKALAIYERAVSENHRFPYFNYSVYLAIAELGYLQGDYQRAAERAKEFIDLAKENSSHALLWKAYDIAGEASARLGQEPLAESYLTNAITEIEESRRFVVGGDEPLQGFFENRISPYHHMIKLLIARGDKALAFEYAERCKSRVLIDVLRGGRKELSKHLTSKELDDERNLRTKMITSNRAASGILGVTLSQGELAKLKSERVNARLDYEVFRAKLYAAHPELAAQADRPNEGITVEDAAKLLPSADSALLQFVVTDERTYLFVLTRDQPNRVGAAPGSHLQTGRLKVYPIDIKRGELTGMVDDFRVRVATPNGIMRDAAQRLYSLLLGDALKDLKDKSVLVIAPDGILWELPFQALERADRYLLEDFSIYYIPSMIALKEIQKSSAKDLGPSTDTVKTKRAVSDHRLILMAVGNPTLQGGTQKENGIEIGVGLSPLPETERLAKRLAALWGPGRSRIYTGASATETSIKKDIKNFEIVHLGAHGIFDEDPMYSYVLFSQTNDRNRSGKSASGDRTKPTPSASSDDGMLEAWEIKDLEINARLVVLSACETGLGRVRIGEGMIGLSWALFMAGCPTVVVSQWQIDGESANELMFDFHSNLKNNLRNGPSELHTAESLRKAALKLMQTKKYRHPYYWGGFVVMGVGS
jgi:CHAT domain-containing protein/tetratricopeptide (TPR) repeat protein